MTVYEDGDGETKSHSKIHVNGKSPKQLLRKCFYFHSIYHRYDKIYGLNIVDC